MTKKSDNPKRRRLVLITAVAAVALLAVSLVVGWQRAPDPLLLTAGPTDVVSARIGDTIRLPVTVELPWFQTFKDIDVTLPEGLQLGQMDRPRLQGIGFGTWTWRAELTLQPYDFGPFDSVQARCLLSAGRDGGDRALVFDLPKIQVDTRAENDRDSEGLVLAQEQALNWWQYITWNQPFNAVIIVLVACAILKAATVFGAKGIMILAAHHTEAGQIRRRIPPWERAEKDLADLGERLPIEPELFFIALTDIIREYIEAVYSLPAVEQTTPEFLEDMNRGRGNLAVPHRELLSECLNAADMVKFARADATQQQLDDTLSKARRFVIETSETIIAAENPGHGAVAVPV